MEETLLNFILGILASIVTTFVLSRTRLFRRFLNKLFGVDASIAYSNQKEAAHDIEKCYKKSSIIKVLTNRGQSFLHGSLSFIIDDLSDSQTLFFLYANTDIGDNYNYVEDRANELIKIDRKGGECFINEVKHTDVELQKLVKTKTNIIAEKHNSPTVFRLIIFQHDLFLLLYTKTSRAVNNVVYRYPSNTNLYHSYLRYFDKLLISSKH